MPLTWEPPNVVRPAGIAAPEGAAALPVDVPFVSTGAAAVVAGVA